MFKKVTQKQAKHILTQGDWWNYQFCGHVSGSDYEDVANKVCSSSEEYSDRLRNGLAHELTLDKDIDLRRYKARSFGMSCCESTQGHDGARMDYANTNWYITEWGLVCLFYARFYNGIVHMGVTCYLSWAYVRALGL